MLSELAAAKFALKNKPPVSFALFFPGIGYSHTYFQRFIDLLPEGTNAYAVCLKGRMHRLTEEKDEDRDIVIKEVVKDIFLELRRKGLIPQFSISTTESTIATLEADLETKTRASSKQAKDDNEDDNKKHDTDEYSDSDNDSRSSADPESRIYLIGHCIGAYLAFELSRLFGANGISSYALIKLVVMSAVSPVYQSEITTRRHHHETTKRSAMDILASGEDVEEYIRYSKSSWQELISRMISMGGVPEKFKDRKDMLKFCLATVRNDFQLLEGYELKEPEFTDFDAEKEGNLKIYEV